MYKPICQWSLTRHVGWHNGWHVGHINQLSVGPHIYDSQQADWYLAEGWPKYPRPLNTWPLITLQVTYYEIHTYTYLLLKHWHSRSCQMSQSKQNYFSFLEKCLSTHVLFQKVNVQVSRCRQKPFPASVVIITLYEFVGYTIVTTIFL